jgi:glycosyltransferase involved in cell wall biosynthesis
MWDKRLSACGSPLRLALVCDFLEEGWHSMDLFGDMLAQCYQQEHAAEVTVEQLYAPFRARFSRVSHRPGSGMFWNVDRLINRFRDYPRWLKKQAARFDLFHLIDHSYGQLTFVLPPGRTVVTCHDLDTFRCLLEPGVEPRPRWFRAMAQRTLDGFLRCSHVICPSNATRMELLGHGWFSHDRVTVIHPGADPIFLSAPGPGSSQSFTYITSGSAEAYLLHVGSTIRRKRIDVLLRVLAVVANEFPEIRLVKAGGALTAEQEALANKLGVADKIVQTPRLSKAQLASVYRKAAILLQTSDAEGFGLPVIEAMACGCPVVASDIAPLQEAGGQAAEYCPPADVEAWSARVIGMLREHRAAPEQWEHRKAIARLHASVFTWPENARQTLAIYRHLSNEAFGPARPYV